MSTITQICRSLFTALAVVIGSLAVAAPSHAACNGVEWEHPHNNAEGCYMK